MASFRISLQQFLVQARSSFCRGMKTPEWQRKVNMVVGNESADLDSLVSALLFAYLRSCAPELPSYHSHQPNVTNLYTPLANLSCADLRLRPDFLALLPHAGLDASLLITLDDLPPPSERASKLPPEDTKWVLVDHNALQGNLGEVYGGRVSGVIDHHEEENAVPSDTGPEPRIVEKSGSCTSLVTEYFRNGWDKLSAQAGLTFSDDGEGEQEVVTPVEESGLGKIYDAQVAKLALGAILIDTANLTSSSKVTTRDTRAVEYLEAKITAAPDGAKWDRLTFYEELNAAKQDISDFSLEEILRQDYKEWIEADGKKLGISTIIRPLPWLLEKALSDAAEADPNKQPPSDPHHHPFLQTLTTFTTTNSLSLLAIMTASTSATGTFQRELFLWAHDPGAVDAVARFEKNAAEELALRRWDGSKEEEALHGEEEGWVRKVWWQGNVGMSRKQVAPLLRGAVVGK
ncbi:MAG: Exopolyphosphatase [Trichoglossum hirsutum]|nr:MAG: Exopolyphosphatase [Trichoglossum hirsutum]